MNIERSIKRSSVFYLIFMLIGLAAAITGFVFDYHRELMTGLTCGFLPTGAGGLILSQYSKKSPQMQKNIQLENEERNKFINARAGHTAFWVSYWYIFIATIAYNLVTIPLLPFLIVTLFFMPTVYFTAVGIYHKKY